MKEVIYYLHKERLKLMFPCHRHVKVETKKK